LGRKAYTPEKLDLLHKKKQQDMQDTKDGIKTVGIRTNFYFQFITTPTSDTPGTSLVLHFDNKRYIIGEIAEGTQRACIQRGVGLRKVRGLFLSGKTTWNNGGLIGLILTLADVQAGEVEFEGSDRRPRLDIHAGPKQLHSLACARRFVFRTGMPLSVHEFDHGKIGAGPAPIYEDINIRAWAIAAQPRNTATAPSTEDLEQSEGSDAEVERQSPGDASQLASEQEVRRQIVNNMFDSDWNRDRLIQCKLGSIKLPAMVWVRDPDTKTLTSYTCFDRNNTAPLTPETVVLVRAPWPASTVEKLADASGLPSRVSMSYIIKGYPQRGGFDAQKAKDLGLKPGPDYGHLIAGRTVEIKDEKTGETIKTITPDMVLQAGRPGRGIAVFDVPSVGHLSDLEQQLEGQTDELLEGIEAAVWITRGNVAYGEHFRRLLQKLKNMKHILSDPTITADYIAHDSSAMSSVRLSNVASEFFSAPRYNNVDAYRPATSKTSEDVRNLFNLTEAGVDVVAAARGMKMQIEPTFVLDTTEVPPNQDLRSINIPMEPALQESLPEDMSPYRRSTTAPSGLDLDEPEIITLGTGSAAPSKYRNVSAVLLRMPNEMGNYLLDCGEGTLGQLKRLYTPEQLDEILFNLRGIWISHLHADHHLGTVSVLRAVHEVVQRLSSADRPRPSPPCLISEVNMVDYLDDYQSVVGIPTDALCTPVACHWSDGLSLRGRPFTFAQVDVPIKELRTVKVNHCHGAQAVSITFVGGFKFSYSGDCRPSESFCVIGADSDVLVHEATFDDGMDGDAHAKKHCTTGEAVGVALKMRARNLVLTHFSQRYQKVPVLSGVKMPEHAAEEDVDDVVDGESTATGAVDETKSTVTNASSWLQPDLARDLNIAVAFDLMHIRVSQIASMKRLLPAIGRMFEIEAEKRDRQRLEASHAARDEMERKRAEKEARRQKKLEAVAAQAAQNKEQKKATKQEKRNNKRKLDQAVTNKM
jgi:ribonuclease Z